MNQDEEDDTNDLEEYEDEHEGEIIYCEVCQHYIERHELISWTGDDRQHWLCPGCDSDLLPVEKLHGE